MAAFYLPLGKVRCDGSSGEGVVAESRCEQWWELRFRLCLPSATTRNRFSGRKACGSLRAHVCCGRPVPSTVLCRNSPPSAMASESPPLPSPSLPSLPHVRTKTADRPVGLEARPRSCWDCCTLLLDFQPQSRERHIPAVCPSLASGASYRHCGNRERVRHCHSHSCPVPAGLGPNPGHTPPLLLVPNRQRLAR